VISRQIHLTTNHSSLRRFSVHSWRVQTDCPTVCPQEANETALHSYRVSMLFDIMPEFTENPLRLGFLWTSEVRRFRRFGSGHGTLTGISCSSEQHRSARGDLEWSCIERWDHAEPGSRHPDIPALIHLARRRGWWPPQLIEPSANRRRIACFGRKAETPAFRQSTGRSPRTI
jgi:hypothetical protein